MGILLVPVITGKRFGMAKKRYRQSKKIRMRGFTERLLVGSLILICVLLVGFCLFMIVKGVGKMNLHRHADKVAATELTQNLSEAAVETVGNGSAGVGNEEEEVTETVELKEGQIFHNGEIWQYNEDILTFLCMGVDSRNGVTDEKVPGKGGQADAVMLIVTNPHNEKIQIININRDTMTDIEIYDTDGGYAGRENRQLALQYAYGDGRVGSCELMEQTVSELFYGIPIHGYAALDMDSIPTLNDSVGGVTVTVPEDMTKYKSGWAKDAEITLNGSDALLYIREREDESAELGSNLKRIERQKQYLSAFINQLIEKTKSDITFPITLYGKVQKHTVTSLSVDEMTYLASTMLGYDFSMKNITGLSGEMAMGEKNEEFYPDDEALRTLIIETFYERY